MISHFTPLKNLLFIDIETVSEQSDYNALSSRYKKAWDHKAKLINPSASKEALYFQKAGIYAEFGKIIAIGVGFYFTENNTDQKFKVKCIHGLDEKALLAELIALIETKFANKKLVLCAHNGIEFDYPYICRRMIANHLNIPKALQLMGKKPWQVEHLDTLELWKFGDRKNFTSLELLATLFDIPGSKDNIDGSMVNEVYYHQQGLESIAKYCMEDVVVTAQIYLRLHNKPLITNRDIFRI